MFPVGHREVELEPVLLIGGGGHCRACIDVVESSGVYSVAGVVETNTTSHGQVLGYPIVGTDAELPALISTYRNALLAVGHVGSPGIRIRLSEHLKGLGASIPVVVSRNACVSRHAKVGPGTIIMHGAIVNAGALIGEGCIVNSGAIVEHDAVIGDHVHVSTRAVVNGAARIGSRTFIGSGAVIFQGVTVPQESIVGAGSVVTKTHKEPGTYLGVPARKVV
jgi:sugar O-acyltransferase (sialic acid O-acetyltransferase NeuD family)